MSNKNLTAKDARKSASQPKDVSADNSRQQHPKASKLQAQDNHVVPRVCTPPSVDNDKYVRLTWLVFTYQRNPKKGWVSRQQKTPDYNHKMISLTTCFQWRQICF